MDSYNPHAFVNSGVCEMMREKFDVAKFMFNSALEIDATLFEAIYNMGENLANFKVHTKLPHYMHFRFDQQEAWRVR